MEWQTQRSPSVWATLGDVLHITRLLTAAEHAAGTRPEDEHWESLTGPFKDSKEEGEEAPLP